MKSKLYFDASSYCVMVKRACVRWNAIISIEWLERIGAHAPGMAHVNLWGTKKSRIHHDTKAGTTETFFK